MRLFLRDRRLDLEPGRPALMGIINANHDSVSDRTRLASLEAQVRRAEEMVQAGATLIDVGAESGRTDQAPRRSGQERALLLPLVEALVKGGITVSVDTWKFEVAASAIGAGAHLINDVSGLADERLAELAAASGAGLVLMHTRAAPKQEHVPSYLDPVADVRALLQQQIARAEAVGVKREQLVLDPGLDFAKSPGDSVEVLRRLGEVGELGRPLLLAVSNKYFVGVVTNRGPVDRVAGTLAAVDAGVKAGATLVRVHDVEEVAAFLRMRAALNGDTVDVEDRSPDERLKWLPLERS